MVDGRRQGAGSLLAEYCGQLGTVLDRRSPGLALVTARQQALQRMLEAKASDDAKTKFLANMSHELRTPVNGVLGMLELVRHTEPGPRQQHYLETARRSAETLLAIINGILDISKIESGKIELEQSPFDLRDLVEDVIETFGDAAYGKGLDLACFVPASLPTALIGDAARLRQILTNLIGNAVKFTENGQIGIRVDAVEADAASAMLAFEVSDTGIGIPADKQRHIFDAFAQADSSTTRRYGGTGLGLSIAKQLCEMMGGAIGLTSEPGKGATFRFTARFAQQRERAQSADIGIAPRRALVAMTHTLNRQSLNDHLSHWGIPARVVENGAAVLAELRGAAIRGLPFQLAIVDSSLPDASGGDLVRSIKADPANADLHLIILGLPDRQSEMIRDNAVGYLAKPVRQSALRAHLLAPSGQRLPSASSGLFMPPPEAAAGARVLLVEDNPVNLEVGVGILEGFGCKVDTATNGVEALGRYANGKYGLIFMDCQMPEMDGFKATAEIRKQEAGSGRRTPIVALTASAIEGDREQCLASGMDDYVPKPFTAEQMRTALTSWLERAGASNTQSKYEHLSLVSQVDAPALRNQPIDEAVLDRLSQLQREGRPDIVNRVITLFIEDAPGLLKELEEGAARGDMARLRHACHALKASSANVGALPLSTDCEELEALARTGIVPDAVMRVATIIEDYQQAHMALTARLPAVA
ncbi:MAG: response regulator [Alphaproteobacteria bacterium]|nr:response regulator [Alphaproteobacteria bacterium]